MTLAMKKMQNIGWLALVFVVAILLYPLSLNVAALHSDLMRVDRKIMETKREISFLEAELRTRASVAQLEEWNSLLYGYEPPTAEQFLNGERALASLGGAEPVVRPVMVSVGEVDGALPAGVVGQPGAAASSVDTEEPASRVAVRSVSDDENKIEQPKAVKETKKAEEKTASVDVKKSTATAETKAKAPIAAPTRTERLAKMDAQLLSDNVLKDIQKKAEKERKRK